jgi:hypothetical protein
MLLSQSGEEPESQSPKNSISHSQHGDSEPPKMTVPVTAESVMMLEQPTDDFLCEISDNIYNIDFVGFQIRVREIKKSKD